MSLVVSDLKVDFFISHNKIASSALLVIVPYLEEKDVIYLFCLTMD
jgi:hypothetical protein